ncbi:MAG: alkane 1-monooxygenase [Stenotrophobium sp.]
MNAIGKYLKFSSMTMFGVVFLAMLILGGEWLWGTVALWLVVAVGGDFVLGRDLKESEFQATWLLDAFLYLSLPLVLLMAVTYGWYISSGDPFGIGLFVGQHLGYDMFTARAATTPAEMIAAFFALGLTFALIGTNVGHELTHRTWSPSAQLIGRWLLAFSFDTSFSVEHVYGHHRNVATREDPASARRGQNLYWFVVTSTVGQFFHAFKLERERLERQKQAVWSWRNRVLRGQLMTFSLMALFIYMAGWTGALVFVALALYAKAYLEFVNFMEHYGIARVPGQPVEPRHSWNCNQRMSTWILYNLPRHSHHHAKGEDAFWKLRAYPQAPMLPYGYLTMILLTLVPPLYRRVMDPLVLEWDRQFSVPEEWPYIEQQNSESGSQIFLHSHAHCERGRSTAQIPLAGTVTQSA